jgi:DNA-binding GntR family transcriptional regulator
MSGARTAVTSRDARPLQVYHTLRELIVRGQLAPGTRIVETEVASRLRVSRTPVRGALQRLQHEGYIVDSPSLMQSRPTVAPLTREDAMELFQIIAEIEGLAARNAATLAAASRAKLVNALTSLNDRFARAAAAKSPRHDLVHDLDERFHQTYVDTAAGPRLRALHASVKPQAERYDRIYVSLLMHSLDASVAEHTRIVEAIESGNADAAQRAVQANWRNAAERLGRVIDRAGERGQW